MNRRKYFIKYYLITLNLPFLFQGHLAVPEDDDEHQYLQMIMRWAAPINDSFWIGVNDIEIEGMNKYYSFYRFKFSALTLRKLRKFVRYKNTSYSIDSKTHFLNSSEHNDNSNIGILLSAFSEQLHKLHPLNYSSYLDKRQGNDLPNSAHLLNTVVMITLVKSW